MTLNDYIKENNAIQARIDAASKQLNTFPKGSLGLVPDSVRATVEYQTAKAAYDRAFSELRSLNSSVPQSYLKEAAKIRRAARFQ